MIQQSKVLDLMFHDVFDLLRVLASILHARITAVAESRNRFEELFFGEVGWEEQKGATEGSEEVPLVCDAEVWLFEKEFDGLVKAAGEVEGFPIGEVAVEAVEVDNTIFDQGTVDCDVGVEVCACAIVVVDV